MLSTPWCIFLQSASGVPSLQEQASARLQLPKLSQLGMPLRGKQKPAQQTSLSARPASAANVKGSIGRMKCGASMSSKQQCSIQAMHIKPVAVDHEPLQTALLTAHLPVILASANFQIRPVRRVGLRVHEQVGGDTPPKHQQPLLWQLAGLPVALAKPCGPSLLTTGATMRSAALCPAEVPLKGFARRCPKATKALECPCGAALLADLPVLEAKPSVLTLPTPCWNEEAPCHRPSKSCPVVRIRLSWACRPRRTLPRPKPVEIHRLQSKSSLSMNRAPVPVLRMPCAATC